MRSTPRRPEQGVIRRGRAAPERLARPKAEQVHQSRTNRRPQNYTGRRSKMGGSRIDNNKNISFGYNSKLLKPHNPKSVRNRNSKVCRFHWYKPFGCAPPKAPLYEVTFSQNSKVEQSQIEILVGMSVFVEDSKSLLPTLGRSTNLNEPWAPL